MTLFDTPVENVDLVLTSNNLAAQFTTSTPLGHLSLQPSLRKTLLSRPTKR